MFRYYDYQNGNVIIPENDFIQIARELKEKDILEQEVLLLKERIDLLESKMYCQKNKLLL